MSRKGSRAVSFQRAPVRLLIRALLGEYWQQSNWQADNRRLPATRRFTRQALTEGNSSQPRRTVQTIHPSRPPQSPQLLYVVFPTCQPGSLSQSTPVAGYKYRMAYTCLMLRWISLPLQGSVLMMARMLDARGIKLGETLHMGTWPNPSPSSSPTFGPPCFWLFCPITQSTQKTKSSLYRYLGEICKSY